MAFNILFLIFLLPVQANINTLQAQKEALLLEYNLVQTSPAAYYVIIDLAAQEAYLKADANLLRTCKILKSFGEIPTITKELTLQNHILPYTPEPKAISRTRQLPLDFAERLTKGPKNHSRLYFMPTFLIQSTEGPSTPHVPGILLNNQDTKAIASALLPKATTIVIPAHSQTDGMPQ